MIRPSRRRRGRGRRSGPGCRRRRAEVAEFQLAVATRAGAPEVVEFEQAQACEHGVLQRAAVTVDVEQLDRQAESRTKRSRARVSVWRGLLATPAMRSIWFSVFTSVNSRVVASDAFDPFTAQQGHPRRRAGGPEVARLVVVELVAAAHAEELQDGLDRGVVRGDVAIPERLRLDRAAAPFEQAADLALEAGAGNIGLVSIGLRMTWLSTAADTDLALAGADAHAESSSRRWLRGSGS